MIKHLKETQEILHLAKEMMRKDHTRPASSAIKEATRQIKYKYTYAGLIAKKHLNKGNNKIENALIIVEGLIQRGKAPKSEDYGECGTCGKHSVLGPSEECFDCEETK